MSHHALDPEPQRIGRRALTGRVLLSNSCPARKDLRCSWSGRTCKNASDGYPREISIGEPERGDTIRQSLNLVLEILQVRSVADFDEAFATAAGQRAGALLILSSPLFGSSMRTVAELALRRNLPGITLFPDFARAGGLLAYGPNLLDMYRQSGVMIGKVLQGRKPADLPIERPTQFQLVVNLRTARTLGLTIPTSILLRADEVIE
jgi:hypothetical protein